MAIRYELYRNVLNEYVNMINDIKATSGDITFGPKMEEFRDKLKLINKDKIGINEAKEQGGAVIIINIEGINYRIKMFKNYGRFFTYFHYLGTDLNIDVDWEDNKCKGLKITLSGKTIPNSPNLYISNGTIEEDDNFKEFIDFYVKEVNSYMVNECVKLLEYKNNIIIQGAPGTGKTYITDSIVLKFMGDDDYKKAVDEKDREKIKEGIKKLKENEQLKFCTFHQTMDYDDFVIGLRPKIKGDKVEYEPEPGIFKYIADKAKDNYMRSLESKNEELKKFVLVIDEINRGNISKIFGELITLLEKGKRMGADQPISVTLPYLSGDDAVFELPPNLYIIGTMNTTDRSAGNLDYAIRRRFAFKTLKSEINQVSENCKDDKVREKAEELFNNINGEEGFINKYKEDPDIDLEDLEVGVSYFMADDLSTLRIKLKYEIVPLLREYIKDGLLRSEKKEQEGQFDAWMEKLRS